MGNDLQQKTDKVYKLDFDLTVANTEKRTLKKELEKQDGVVRRMKKDYEELEIKFNLITDENEKNLK